MAIPSAGPKLFNLNQDHPIKSFLLKQYLKTQRKLKELEISYQNAIDTCIS